MFWLTATLGVVLVAYIWMENITDRVTGEPVKKLSPAAAAKTTQRAEIFVKKETKAITNENDSARAKHYLEVEFLETSTTPLMQSAEQYIQDNQLALPKSANAWDNYQKVLELAPGNNRAKSGLTRVRNKLIDNAETAIFDGEYANAEIWLNQLDRIQPEASLQVDLRNQIKQKIGLDAVEKLRQQQQQELQLKVSNAIAQAETEEQNSPVNYNKIKDLYVRVLELDEGNEIAQTGLEKLMERLLDDADASLRKSDLVISAELLSQAEDIFPDDKRLGSLKLALDTSLKHKEEQEIAAEKLKSEQQVLSANTSSSATKEISSPIPIENLTENQNEIQASDNNAEIAATDEELAQLKQKQLIQDGIGAYYDGDYNKSFEILYPLAEEGVTRAQFRIGVMYRYGRSVAKNLDLSEKWFTQALPSILRLAQQGVPWAQTDLGTSYELGIALKQDFERAAHWYKLAADQDYPGAQTNLGVLYANGEGVDYSRSQAVFWLKKAARQGDLVALGNLKIMGTEL